MITLWPSRPVVSMGGSVGRGEASGVTSAAGKAGRADAKFHRHVHHEPVKHRAEEDIGIVCLPTLLLCNSPSNRQAAACHLQRSRSHDAFWLGGKHGQLHGWGRPTPSLQTSCREDTAVFSTSVLSTSVLSNSER